MVCQWRTGTARPTVSVSNDPAAGIVRSDPKYHLDAPEGAGPIVTEVGQRSIGADVQTWFELMTADHDTVLGWVGITQPLDGQSAAPEALGDRRPTTEGHARIVAVV